MDTVMNSQTSDFVREDGTVVVMAPFVLSAQISKLPEEAGRLQNSFGTTPAEVEEAFFQYAKWKPV
jgi:hypothetical protein